MKKIAIYGAYGEGNIGDDLLLDTIITWLKKKSLKSEVLISANEKEYLEKLYPQQKIISKIKTQYANPDLFVLGGGTQFFSFKNSQNKKSNKLSTASRIFRNNPSLVFDILRSKIKEKKSKKHKIALGVGLGPFEEANSDRIVKEKLGDFDMVYCRDQFSFDICKKHQINSELVADICFSDYFRRKYPFRHVRNINNKPQVGVILRDWKHNAIGEVINNKIIKWIDDNNETYNISIFLFSYIKDQEIRNRLAQNEFAEVNVWNPNKNNFYEFLENFSKMDALITSRFHAGVFGANFEIPTICLGIDPKLYYLKEEIEGFCYFQSDQEVEDLNKYLNDFFSNYNIKQLEIKKSAEKLTLRANNLFEQAGNFL